MNRMTRRAALTLAATLALSSCGTGAQVLTNPSPPPPTSSSAPGPSETGAPATPEQQPAPQETSSPAPGVAKFGETFHYEDGLTVTVGPPKRYVPDEYAVGSKRDNVSFVVTLTNGTGKRFDPAGLYISASDAKGDVERVFDGRLDSDPTVALRDGKTVTWTIAFGTNSPALDGLTVEVHPPFGVDGSTYDVATFEN